MTTKAEWKEAFEPWNAELCEEMGGCPTREECEALYRGQLTGDEALRMSARIMFCVGAPFPEEGDPLTPEQLDADWQKILARLRA